MQAGQTALDGAKQRRDDAKDLIKKSKIDADQRQLHLKSREAKIEDLKIKLNQAASNKEYQLLKDQIAADQQANGVLADEILEILERIDSLNADLLAREQELKESEGRQKKLGEDVSVRSQRYQEDLGSVERNLTEVETKLPSDFQIEYRRLVSTRGEEALAPVEAATCQGCYQTLTTHLLDQLAMNLLVSCPNCGAVLYLPEDRRITTSTPD
jgi:hypothetical protein